MNFCFTSKRLTSSDASWHSNLKPLKLLCQEASREANNATRVNDPAIVNLRKKDLTQLKTYVLAGVGLTF